MRLEFQLQLTWVVDLGVSVAGVAYVISQITATGVNYWNTEIPLSGTEINRKIL